MIGVAQNFVLRSVLTANTHDMHRRTKQAVGELLSKKPHSQFYSTKPQGLHDRRLPASSLKQPRALPQQHFEQLKGLTHELIGRNTDGINSGWEYTRSLRGEEKRLNNDIKKHRAKVSIAQEEFHAAEPDEQFVDSSPDQTVLPGTFVEVRRCASCLCS